MKAPLEIYEVENGFILKIQNDKGEETQYVFTSIDKLTDWLKGYFKRKEKSKDEE